MKATQGGLCRFAPMENAEVYRNALTLKKEPFYETLLLTNLNVYPFLGNGWASAASPTMAYLATLGRYLLFYPNTAHIDDDKIKVCTFAELVAPSLPETIKLDNKGSSIQFVKSVKALMKYINLASVTSGNRTLYIQECQKFALIAGGNLPKENVHSVFLQHVGSGMYRAPLVDMWPVTPNEVDVIGMEPEDASVILFYLAIKILEKYHLSELTCIVHIIVSLASRGIQPTDPDIFHNDMLRELGFSVNLNKEVSRQFFKMYGTEINDASLNQLILCWTSQIPRHVLLKMAQMAGGRLTPYYAIKNALKSFPDFPWDKKISVMFPQELNNFNRAVELVGDNMSCDFTYYRETSIMKYRNLAYVAKELLIRIDEQKSLLRYRGWSRHVPFKETVDQLITKYQQQRGEGNRHGESGKGETAN